jgi:hypothetical protein
MSGIGDDNGVTFDPKRETEIAMSTNWRQIYPLENTVISSQCETALERSRLAPQGGIMETATTRKRKEAVIAKLTELPKVASEPRKTVVVKPAVVAVSVDKRPKATPRSVLLANEARSQRMKAASQRMLFQNPTRGPFECSEGMRVKESEEAERIKVLRAREVQTAAMGMLAQLRALVVEKERRLIPAIEAPKATAKVTRSQIVTLPMQFS